MSSLKILALLALTLFISVNSAMGSYKSLSPQELTELKESEDFKEIQRKVNEAYVLRQKELFSRENAPEPTLIAAKQQIVSGINYQLLYECPETLKLTAFKIYTQSWTETFEITEVLDDFNSKDWDS